MKRFNGNSQSGYALIMLVLFLMTLGGFAVTGFTQNFKKQADHERFLHNEAVLKAAKQALLMYAYRYPETALAFNGTLRGPGRLPCPDTDIPGTPGSGNPDPDIVTYCIVAGNAMVGRFPWNANGMEFYDARDASGERLWYAVSQNFNNFNPAGVINSDTIGSITIHDQTGSVLHDGSVGDIAAVIIAPGPAIDRAGVTQNRQTGAQQIQATNYLDLFGLLDNSDFINGSAVDGFVLGPVDNLAAGTIIVNDQMILVTTEEVIAMAEKATLQAYKKAINDYRANILPADAYPWLDDYVTLPNPPVLYDADVGTRIGRLPSIFANYFDGTNLQASQPIDSDLKMAINVFTVNGFVLPTVSPDVISFGTSVVFAANGDLTITPTVNGISHFHYYWDESVSPDGWAECLPVIQGDQRDCRQATAAPGIPDGNVDPNEVATRVVLVTYTNTLTAGTPFTRDLSDRTIAQLEHQPPTAVDHAYVFAEYFEGISDAIDVDFVYDSNYFNTFDNQLSGDVAYFLGVRYYPELAAWSLDNDWHNSVQVSYAAGFVPDGAEACGVGTCLTVNNIAGVPNDKEALLVIAADHGMTTFDDGAPGFQDDLAEIFDAGHIEYSGTEDDIFDARPPVGGNDQTLIIN